MDIDPTDNPFIRGTTWDFTMCRFTHAQVEAVLAIETVSGARVWRWGGDFGDYMHWQLDCKPDDIETGINTEDDMTWADIVADATWAKAYADGFIQGNAAVMPDYYFAGGPATEDEKKNAYNVIMQNQMEATK
jgi:hypothetical protein